jgi:hypothetical protein
MTMLIRLVDTRDLGCTVFTGYRNQSTGEQYTWGIRRRNSDTAVEIIDRNSVAVAGPSISVTVDGSQIGTYPVTRRLERGGYNTVVAELSARDAGILIPLLRVGGAIKFTTDAATYSASLDGARQAMANFDACVVEAAQINAAHQQPQ